MTVKETASHPLVQGMTVSFRDEAGMLIEIDLDRSATASERNQILSLLEKARKRGSTTLAGSVAGANVKGCDSGELFRSWAHR